MFASDEDPGPFACSAGPEFGKVYVKLLEGWRCFDRTGEFWAPAGYLMDVQAYPPRGWVFLGWPTHLSGSQAYEATLELTGSLVIWARFEPAVQVRVETLPPGLQVLVDRAPARTPARFDWVANSTHALSPVSPQRDSTSTLWVFESWGHGGDENQLFTVGPAHVPVTLTARYAPGVPVGVLSNPPGLRLAVDGRNWPYSNFLWGLGSKHTISAPPEQTGSNGRRYLFRSWSNGGDASQEITVTAGSAGWVATYEKLSSLTVRTTPNDLTVVVDDIQCGSPCTVHRVRGTEVQIAVPATATPQTGVRLGLQGWSDGAPATRTWKLDTDQQTLVAIYKASYRLVAAADPSQAADLQFEPASGDGFYEFGTAVTLTVRPRPGYRFRRWEGDLSGVFPSGVVSMSGARAVRAVLVQVYYNPPPVVRNAAGDAPEPVVAPGPSSRFMAPDSPPARKPAPIARWPRPWEA